MKCGRKTNLRTKTCLDTSELEDNQRNCSECKKLLETKTVARNTRSCEKVAEQLVEIPNPKATEDFIWKEIASPPGLLENKNSKKDVSFSTFFCL